MDTWVGTTNLHRARQPAGQTETRLGVLVPVLPRGFPFRNGFADQGRRGHGGDRQRQRKIFLLSVHAGQQVSAVSFPEPFPAAMGFAGQR